MAHATLTPVFVGLRVGLHVLLVGLAAFAVVPGFVTERSSAPGALLIAILFVAVYAGGVLLPRKRVPATLWVAALTLLWAVLVWLAPEGAYLVFPLFFLYLHVLPGAGGIIAVIASTAIAILALGLHLGFSVGGVIGPLVGAGAAILIGLGYRALAREAAERQELVDELLRTRERLAATEREQGALAERARLAREIHDTVAQGLSSIQMLLHAAERDDPDGAGARHVRLARETAADSLAETRRFIRELAPPSLDDGFAAALRRLAEDQSRRSGLAISVETPDELHLPMSTQTALLRIAQGAVSNVVRHAAAGRARILVEAIDGRVTLSVHDDGVGFDPEHVAAGGGSANSFGLRAIAERARQLGGTLVVESEPGRGTLLSVTLERGDA